MMIKAVRLENIRSHTNTLVVFEKGFNCLIGGLGAGKTSILYAIDFALFGEPLGRSYAYLLREGASRGRVTLWFKHGGSEYVLIRGLRRTGTGIAQDTGVLRLYKDGEVIAEKRASSVAEQLAREIGVDLQFFREVMWIRQEKLKEILDVSPRDRQRKLDALFGLSYFEEGWSKLREVEGYYKNLREIYEKDPDVLALEELTREHAELVEEFARVSSEMEDLRLEVDKAGKDLEEARTRLSELEEARRKLEKLRGKEISLEASIKEAERAVERLSRGLEARRARIRKLEEELEALATEEAEQRRALALSGLEMGAGLDEVGEALRALEDELYGLREKAIRIRQEMDSIKNRLDIITRESICPTCLRFIDDAYRRDLTSKLKKELVRDEHDLEGLEERIRELEEKKNTLSRALEALRLIETRKSDLRARLEDERALLEQEERELDSTRMRLDMLKVELEDLRSRLAELTPEEVEEARREVERRSRKLMELEGKLRDLASRRELIRDRLSRCEERLKLAEEKMREAEKARALLEIVKLIRAAYRSVQPHLRTEIVRAAKFFIQRVLDEISGPEGSDMVVEVGQDYTPVVRVAGRERSINHLSGGERTLLALAYRIGMGHLIARYRGAGGLDVLLLDEPTESLGREDMSIDKMADALARLRAVEQVIAVTHSEAFAEKAEHVIRVEKVDNESRVRAEARPRKAQAA